MDRGLSQELRRQLFARRIVLLSGALDTESSRDGAAQLMTLDATGDEPVVLRMQGVDADYDAALPLMDVIELLGVPVHARCSGVLAAAAVGLVAVSTHRWGAPHSAFHLRDPRASAEGSFGDLQQWAEQRAHVRELFARQVAAAIGSSPDALGSDLERGRMLDAEQALAYGLLDEVGGTAESVSG